MYRNNQWITVQSGILIITEKIEDKKEEIFPVDRILVDLDLGDGRF